MEGAASYRLVAVRRGGTPMRQMRRPEGPSLASIGPGSAVLGIPSVLHAASWLRPVLSRCFWALSTLPVQS